MDYWKLFVPFQVVFLLQYKFFNIITYSPTFWKSKLTVVIDHCFCFVIAVSACIILRPTYNVRFFRRFTTFFSHISTINSDMSLEYRRTFSLMSLTLTPSWSHLIFLKIPFRTRVKNFGDSQSLHQTPAFNLADSV